MIFPVEGSEGGIVIREFQPHDIEQCKYLLEHTQGLYGNPAVYVKMTFETDMKDIVRNYLELTDQDLVLPTSCTAEAHTQSETTARRRGTWLVAVDTNNKTAEGHDTVCGQVAIHPLCVGDPNVFKYYEEKAASYLDTEPSQRAFPYCLNFDAYDVCELRRMAVLPDYQSKKIGFSLLKAFAAFAKDILSYKIVHLTTLVSMRQAVAFYTRQGFICERLEFLRMGNVAKQEEGQSEVTYLPGVVERKEIHGGLESLSETQSTEAVLGPAVSGTLYVVHFWKVL